MPIYKLIPMLEKRVLLDDTGATVSIEDIKNLGIIRLPKKNQDCSPGDSLKRVKVFQASGLIEKMKESGFETVIFVESDVEFLKLEEVKDDSSS